MAASFRVHFIVSVDGGRIISGGGPVLDPKLQEALGRERLGHPGTYAVACDPAIQLDEVNRGTDRPYAVHCPRCQETKAWQEANKRIPHPGQRPGRDEVETADNPMDP